MLAAQFSIHSSRLSNSTSHWPLGAGNRRANLYQDRPDRTFGSELLKAAARQITYRWEVCSGETSGPMI